jgi:hypothetical protein
MVEGIWFGFKYRFSQLPWRGHPVQVVSFLSDGTAGSAD